jgi:cytochrome P450
VIELDVQTGAAAAAWRSDPCAVLYELASRHPGQPVTLRLGDEVILLFQDAQSMQHIGHLNAGNYHKNFAGFRQFFGASRLTNDGAAWQASRDLSQPAISATRRLDVARATERIFAAACATILETEQAPNEPLPIDPHLDDATGRVIAEVTLGFRPDELSAELADDFRELLRHASLTTWNVPGAPQLRAPELWADVTATRTKLRTALDALIARRRKAGDLPELLSALSRASESGGDTFAEVCGLLFAGFDTSSAALGWALWLLAEAPQLQSRLREQVRGCADGQTLDLEQVLNLDELSAFLAEALRIFPPVPILSRVAVDADLVNGVAVAAGQKVLLSVIGLHLDPIVFPQPRRVALQRFPNGEVSPELRGHFLPFGVGRRSCAGARIATTELTIGLAVLLRNLTFQRPKNETLAFDWLASLRRRGGQRLLVAAA